jgi:16S rRNA C1402 N4-methylase RsmH
VGQNLFENNLKRLPEIEKARMQDSIRNHIRPFCFDVIKRKNKSKPNVEKAFQKIRIWVNKEST